jgi:hypothetical protein
MYETEVQRTIKDLWKLKLKNNIMFFFLKFHLAIWWFLFGLMMFNATFNNISVISRLSVLLVEETGENHWQHLSHNVVSSTPRHERRSNSQLQGKFEKILKAFFTLRIFCKKIPVIQVTKGHYLPSAIIEYRPILPLTIVLEIISWKTDHD